MNKRLIGAAVCAGIVLTACGSGSDSASSSAPSAAVGPASTVTVTATATTTQKSTATKTSTATETETVTQTETETEAAGPSGGGSEDALLCDVATNVFHHLDAVEGLYASGDNPLSFVVSEAKQARETLDGVSYFFEGGGGYGLQLKQQWQVFELQANQFENGGSVEDWQRARAGILIACTDVAG